MFFDCDMGCFPCFGSSEDDGKNGEQEVVKKDSFKEGSAPQSHHMTRVGSGNLSPVFFFC